MGALAFQLQKPKPSLFVKPITILYLHLRIATFAQQYWVYYSLLCYECCNLSGMVVFTLEFSHVVWADSDAYVEHIPENHIVSTCVCLTVGALWRLTWFPSLTVMFFHPLTWGTYLYSREQDLASLSDYFINTSLQILHADLADV